MATIKNFDGITLNGQPVALVSNWGCACSGGHPIDEPDAKCYRKGGGMMDDLVVGDKVIASADDWDDEWNFHAAPRRIFINGPGYVQSLDEAVAVA